MRYKVAKRIFDVIVSSALLIVLSPFMILIGILVKFTSKGPVFYVHERVGYHRQPVGVYKYRTMYMDADEIKERFTVEQQREWNENFKLVNDPRLTKVGDFLRKSSLDELPQLLNVLQGNMSLVGPRPIILQELDKYGSSADKFLSVKPGLTGYWQAYARNSCSYDRRIEMELYYVEHASILFDIRILFRTIGRVLSQEGAV